METNQLSITKQTRIQVVLAIILSTSYGLFLYYNAFSWMEISRSVGFSIFEILVGGQLVTTVFRYFQPKVTFAFVPIFIVFLLTLILSSAFHAIIVGLIPSHYRPIYFEGNLGVHFLILFFVLWVLYYEWWFKKNEVRNDQNTQRLLLLQADLKNAEIKNIQQNIQPHFLFNSLNSISALTISAPEEAQKMVVKLSDFLRHSVVKNQKMFVPLREELDQIERYLAIEQIRFSHRLNFILEHEEANDNIEIPAMILQPLIENAIKFGLYGQIGIADIRIKTSSFDNYLKIQIENPDSDLPQSKVGTGFGLSGLKKKLYLLYAENRLLETERENGVFRSVLKIPLQVPLKNSTDNDGIINR